VSEVSNSPSQVRRPFPLCGYAIDVLVYLALTTILMVAVLAMMKTREAEARQQAWTERALAGPQRVFLALECPSFDQAALFAELSRHGDIQPAAPGAAGAQADTAGDPRVIIAPLSSRAFASRALDAPDPRFVVVELVITPRTGDILILDIHGILASSGCERVTAQVHFDPNGPAFEAAPMATNPPTPSTLLGLMLASVAAAILTWTLRARRLPRSLLPRPLAASIGFALVAAFALQAFVIAASQLLMHWGIALSPSNIEPIRVLHDAYPVATLLLIVGLVPIAEELFFRDLLLRRFALARRPAAGLLLSAGFFALLHELVPNSAGLATHLATLLLYLAMGIGFGAIYLRTGRLSAVFLAHVTVNAFGIAGLLWVPSA
jgi:membrane protease YdiL (CAAX protease family)